MAKKSKSLKKYINIDISKLRDSHIEILGVLTNFEEMNPHQIGKHEKFKFSHSTADRRTPDLAKMGYIFKTKEEPSRARRIEKYYKITIDGFLAFCKAHEKFDKYINRAHLISEIINSKYFKGFKKFNLIITQDFVIGLIKLWKRLARDNEKLNRPTIVFPGDDFGTRFLVTTIRGVQAAIFEHLSISVKSEYGGIGHIDFSNASHVEPLNLIRILMKYGNLEKKESSAIIKYLILIDYLNIEMENLLLLDKYIKFKYMEISNFWIRGYLPLDPHYISISIEIDQPKFIETLKSEKFDFKKGKLNEKIIKKIVIEDYYKKTEDYEIIAALKNLYSKIKSGKHNVKIIDEEIRKFPRPFRIITDYKKLKKMIKELNLNVKILD